ncbi:dTDP-4-dehydrorhamnose 3,5-epimerase [Lachnospiraceae bacterium]|nr:dTDP-4-dehydrorhamnose 3,5-epimerase [Lachnospiraceae bacterium]
MNSFRFEKLDIDGVWLIHPFQYEDDRGVFIKDFDSRVFIDNGLGNITFKEEFYSLSHKNVIRGLHFQTLRPQSKIVSCISGCIFDVIVDLRRDSSTFGQYIHVELSDKNHDSVFIPKGCAHGFLSLNDNTVTYYKCDDDYLQNNDSTIKWNDPDIGILWPLDDVDKVIMSDRDINAMSFKNFIDSYGGL